MEFISFIMGAVIGIVFSSIYYLGRRSTGTLRIDHSNPEKDIYRFDVLDIEKLSSKKEIILKIDNNADLSQK